MTRFSKKQLPSSLSRGRRSIIAAVFISTVLITLIGTCAFQRRNSNDTVSTSTIANAHGYSGDEHVDDDTDGSTLDAGFDFYQGHLRRGELLPVTWKSDGKWATPNAYRVAIPPRLSAAMKAYCDDIGLSDLARKYISTPENNIEPNGFRYVTLNDGLTWYAQRPAKKWFSDMHWISPANELGHEVYLKLLRDNGFLSVLNVIGDQLELEGLAAYHLTFIVVSHCEEGFVHHDTTQTGNKVFNVIIPLEMVDASPPELMIADDEDADRIGRLKYEKNVAVLIGDDAEHGTSECDYRDRPGAIRLAATVYIADINKNNAEAIAGNTLTQAFPLPDVKWVLSQRARHWESAEKRSDKGDGDEIKHFVGDRGRGHFSVSDRKGVECAKLSGNDSTKCYNDDSFRRKCPLTCGIYLNSSYWADFS